MKNDNVWHVTIIAILVILVLVTFTSHWGYSGMMYSYGFMPIFMFLIWALIIVFLVLGIMWFLKQIKK